MFIKEFKNFLSEQECESILAGHIAKNLKSNTIIKASVNIIEYLVVNKECSFENYYLHSMRIIHSKDLMVSDEIEIGESGEDFIRNFRVLISLQEGLLKFPNQNLQLISQPGDLLVYPASFMYPSTFLKDSLFWEMRYYFKKEIIINSEESRPNEYRI